MPPKKDESIQAVVLCDSYKNRFAPLNRKIPRCLLPLANKPLIDYTLEFLQSARVSQVFLLCCAHANQVEEYLANSKWARAPFTIDCISLPNSTSVGDAMRDIDARGIIKNDFLLISGDVLANLDFNEIWTQHQARKRKDKDCIMTITLRAANPMHRTRSTKPGIYVLEQDTSQVLSYKPYTESKVLSIDATDIFKHSSCNVRNDLIDCHIDICTIDVPALFTENFDYETLRRDFVCGILQSELLGKTIYANVVYKDYAARVENFRTYDAVSRDLIARYVYPNSLDIHYSYSKGHIYKGVNVQLSQTCSVGSCTVIGDDTSVGSGSKIEYSTVGSNCQIGDKVIIKSSYVWDNVKICDGAVIENSIIAKGSIVEAGAHLDRAIVSFDQDVEGIVVTSAIGDDSDAASDEDLEFLAEEVDYLHLSDDSISSVRASSGGSVPASQRRHRKSRTLSTSSVLTAEDEDEDFFKEAVASINRSIVDNHSQDVAVLELNTLRMTMNASHDKVREAAVHALLSHIAHLITQGDVKTASVTVWKQWSPLLKRITFDQSSEVELSSYIESECAKSNQGEKLLFYAISTLYDTDVLKEESIHAWWSQPPVSAKTREIIFKWIEWLQNAEEDSDEEESD